MTNTAAAARYQNIEYRSKRLLRHNELSHPLFALVDALQEANKLNSTGAPRARRNRS